MCRIKNTKKMKPTKLKKNTTEYVRRARVNRYLLR